MKIKNREKSKTGIYHVTNKGNNQRDIFFDELDHKTFLNIFTSEAKKLFIEILSYCNMGNHFHFLIYDPFDNISILMQNSQSAYAKYFNKRYNTSGHLFQGPYHSSCVEDSDYLKNSVRYINRNPVKALLCKKAESYRWSSAKELKSKISSIVNVDYIIKLLSKNGISDVMEFINDSIDDDFFDSIESYRMKDNEAKKLYEKLLYEKAVDVINEMDILCQIKFVSNLRKRGMSIRQVCNSTGFSKHFVEKTRF